MNETGTPANDPTDPRYTNNAKSNDRPGNPNLPANAGNTEPLAFGPSDEEIAAELSKYRKALAEEFAREEATDSVLTGLDDPVSNVEKYTRNFFKQNLPDAAAQIVWLSCNSDSDSVRLRASKMIVDIALDDARQDGDPLKELLNSLKKTPTAAASSDR